jgi:hypothetical protein
MECESVRLFLCPGSWLKTECELVFIWWVVPHDVCLRFLPLCLSLHVYLLTHLSVFLYTYICHLPISVSVSLYVYQFIFVSVLVRVSVNLCVCVCVCGGFPYVWVCRVVLLLSQPQHSDISSLKHRHALNKNTKVLLTTYFQVI